MTTHRCPWAEIGKYGLPKYAEFNFHYFCYKVQICQQKNLQHRQIILFLGFFRCTLQITEAQICPFTVNISWSYINPGREPKKMLGVVNQVLIKFTSLNQIFLDTPYTKEHVTDWHDKLNTVQNYKKYDTEIEPTTKELTSSTQGADSFSRSCSWIMCFKYSITKD